MRKRILVGAFLLTSSIWYLTSGFCRGGYADGGDSGLVGYWKFDGGLKDEAGVYDATMGPSGTSVSGRISTHTTWSTAGSPYFVVGNILVDEGVTLTIEPGATIKFSVGTYLRIDGTLEAEGTSSNKIIFTSNKTTPSAGDWQYIKFADSSVDASCVVKYCEIKYAEYGIYCDNASPTISYSTISYNSNRGIYIPNGSPTISNNTISNNGYNGIDIGNGTPSISNNTISYNNEGITTWDSPLIENNTISNNTTGIRVNEGNPPIRNNVISNNEKGIHNSNSWGTLSISNNSISNNSYGIYASASVSVGRNTISNNSRGIYLGGYGPHLISSNTITGNGGGIYISIYGEDNPVITTNNIYNSTSTYNIENRSGNDITATNNWWGTTDTNQIDNKIFDFYDDFTYGKVLYDPIATHEYDFRPAPEVTSLTAEPPTIYDTYTGTITLRAKVTNYPEFITEYRWSVAAPPFAGARVGSFVGEMRKVRTSSTTYEFYYGYSFPEGASVGTYTIQFTVVAPVSIEKTIDFVVTETGKEEGQMKIGNNVFNPIEGGYCTIFYTNPQGREVRAKIYDISGDLVKDSLEESGENSLRWDGTNDNGQIVASDLYFVVIRIGDWVDRQPVEVIK